MNHAVIIPAIVLLLAHSFAHHAPKPTAEGAPGGARISLRIAIIGFIAAKANNDPHQIDAALSEALSHDTRVALIDRSLVQPALIGIGYDGSINMSKDEARSLGAAIGCDFFIIGKTESLTRSSRENESHEEAYAGVMIVNARTGSLATFDFIFEKSDTREAALSGLIKTLLARASGYVDRIGQVISVRASEDSARDAARPQVDGRGGENIEDIPDEGSPRAVGFAPPEFLNRVKPEYPAEAEQADIKATVEAMVVFRLNGEVGRVEITRWAGFGLEESAERAIRQLKFKPATHDGKPVSVRAMIRYNFRRIIEPTSKSEQGLPKPPEKPERDLRQLMKPSYRRP
jgi:TonB family protein